MTDPETGACRPGTVPGAARVSALERGYRTCSAGHGTCGER